MAESVMYRTGVMKHCSYYIEYLRGSLGLKTNKQG